MENNNKMWNWAKNVWWIAGISGGLLMGAYMFVVSPIFEIKNDVVLMKYQLSEINKRLEKNETITCERIKLVDGKLDDYGTRLSHIEYVLKLK